MLHYEKVGVMTGNTEELCQAVLGFVAEGTYPEESVVAGKFPAAALARELELISKAREQVEVRNPNVHLHTW